MAKSSTYIYNAGESDKVRLKLLNDAYNPFSMLKLKELLHNKNVIIDMGCGQGDITCWLSQQVSKETTIIAVDIDAEQLALAKQKATQLNAQNIIFCESSIQDFTQDKLNSLGYPAADLIFCRWVLIHLDKESIAKSLHHLKTMLSPEGLLVNEEVDLSGSHHPREPESYAQYKSAFNQLATEMAIDFNLGPKLKPMLEKIGLDVLREEVSNPLFSKAQLSFFTIDLQSAVAQFEQFNVLTQSEVDRLCIALDDLPEQDIQKIQMKNYLTVSSRIA